LEVDHDYLAKAIVIQRRSGMIQRHNPHTASQKQSSMYVPDGVLFEAESFEDLRSRGIPERANDLWSKKLDLLIQVGFAGCDLFRVGLAILDPVARLLGGATFDDICDEHLLPVEADRL
jgi:hypothetical protein